MKSPRTMLLLLPLLAIALTVSAFAQDGTTSGDVVYALMNILPEKWRALLLGICPLLVAARFAGKILCTAFHEYCLSTETKKDDEFFDHAKAALAPFAKFGFWIDLLLSVKSASAYRGQVTPAAANPNPASSATGSPATGFAV